MSKQHIEYNRQLNQNKILDLEEKYMYVIEDIVTSKTFFRRFKTY